MKTIVEKLTQRLDHMVPERTKRTEDEKAIKAFKRALAEEEKQIARRVRKN
jgi:hypothetical protein